MSVQPNPQTEVDVEAGQVRGKGPGFGSTGERFMPLDGEYNIHIQRSSFVRHRNILLRRTSTSILSSTSDPTLILYMLPRVSPQVWAVYCSKCIALATRFPGL